MKMRMSTLGALVLGGLLLAAPCLRAAFDKDAPEPKGAEQGPAMMGGHGFEGGFNFEGLKEDLGLSEGQLDKLREASKANRIAMAPLMAQLKNDHDDLAALVEKKAKDGALSAALDKLKLDGEALSKAQASHRDDLAAILSPLQQAKFVLHMGEGFRGKGLRGEHGKKECKGTSPQPQTREP